MPQGHFPAARASLPLSPALLTDQRVSRARHLLQQASFGSNSTAGTAESLNPQQIDAALQGIASTIAGQGAPAAAPISSQASASGGTFEAATNASTALAEGKWPLSCEQTACVRRAATASPELDRFLYLSALAGTTVLYGEGSPEVEELRSDPDARELGSSPVRQVLQEVQAWASRTLSACGAPSSFTYGDPADPLARLPFLLSFRESDIPGGGGGGASEAAPGGGGGSGRRLLSSFTFKGTSAFAIGLGAGLLGGALGSVALDLVLMIACQLWPLAGPFLGLVLGLIAAIVIVWAINTVRHRGVGWASSPIRCPPCWEASHPGQPASCRQRTTADVHPARSCSQLTPALPSSHALPARLARA